MLQFHPILRDIYTSRGIKAIKQSFNEKANLSLAVDIPSVAAAALRHTHINAAAGFHIAAPFNIIVCADREKENASARADRNMLSAKPILILHIINKHVLKEIILKTFIFFKYTLYFLTN